MAYPDRTEPRLPGSMVGRMSVADDFDDTPQWLVDSFEGNDATA